MPNQSQIFSSGANLPTSKWMFDGYNLGVNNFALATELKGNELAAALNHELYGKKSVRPRRGGERLGSALGSSGGIDGLFQYQEGATNEILAILAGTMKKFNPGTNGWDAVTGGTFTSGLRTRGVKMRGAHYFGNGTDDFSKYNGTQVSSFSAVAAPIGLAVAPQGAAGTAKYSYEVTANTEKGESLPCTAVEITNGNATLSATNFNRVTFNRIADSQVISYGVYGRTTTGMGRTLILTIPQPASGNITWDDDGSLTPTIWMPPDGDSTDGIKATMWEQLRGSLVAAGVTGQEHRMFYTGTGDRYESFSPSHNGGWVDVRPGDNDPGISGFAPFESKIIVLKNNSIHQFYFSSTTGDAVIQEIITYVGCGAPGSVVVMDNDVGFLDSDRKLRILGYEPNYQAAIRTTTLSEGRIQASFDNIDPNYLTNCEAVYYKGRYILAATSKGSTTNDFILAYDRRYLAFLGTWDGADCHVRCWCVYDGIGKQKKLFAGSSDTPYVFEFGVEGKLTNHDATMVNAYIRTRNEDMGNSGQQKIWKWADLRLFRITGTIKLKILKDGALTLIEKTLSSSTSTGWGIKKWNETLWGVSTGTAASASDLDQTYRREMYDIGNSMQFELSRVTAITDYILVSMRGEAFLLPTEVFDTSKMF